MTAGAPARQLSLTALAAIPDEIVDALIVHGSYDECREHVGRYMANGVDIPVMAVMPVGVSLEEAVKGLAPPWPHAQAEGSGREEPGAQDRS